MIIKLVLACIICSISFLIWSLRESEDYYDQIVILDMLTVPTTHSSLQLMTFNMRYGIGPGLSSIGKPDTLKENLSLLQSYLNQQSPDILCVQEIDIHSNRSNQQDLIKKIAKTGQFNYVAIALTWNKRWIPYPYHILPSKQFGKTVSAMAVFSKYPIKNQQILTLEKPSNNWFFYNWFYIDRLVQKVEIELSSNKIFNLANVHLEAFDKTHRELQALELTDWVQKNTTGNVHVLAGDFNAIPNDALLQGPFEDEPHIDYKDDKTLGLIQEKLNLKRVPSAHTFPTRAPNRALDHILYNASTIKIKEAKVHALKTSDHLPLEIKFDILGS